MIFKANSSIWFRLELSIVMCVEIEEKGVEEVDKIK